MFPSDMIVVSSHKKCGPALRGCREVIIGRGWSGCAQNSSSVTELTDMGDIFARLVV